MKPLAVSLVLCLTVLATVSAFMFTWQRQENQRLAATNSRLVEALQGSQKAVTNLTAENVAVSDRVKALETMETDLRDRLSVLEAATEAAASFPRPYPVRAFVGTESVGQAWMIPHNVKRDSESGRYTFEPVLAIDASAKNLFTVHHTNVVERDVYTTEVYDDYGYYPYYYYVWGGNSNGSNRPPTGPVSPPSRPPNPSVPVTQAPSARTRLFAPPMSIVNTRPQVIGTPHTSPINERVFAP